MHSPLKSFVSKLSGKCPGIVSVGMNVRVFMTSSVATNSSRMTEVVDLLFLTMGFELSLLLGAFTGKGVAASFGMSARVKAYH